MNTQEIIGQYHTSLRELLELEVVDIVATAVEQGFSSRETLEVLVDTAQQRLADMDEASTKTPAAGALPEPGKVEIDPGIG